MDAWLDGRRVRLTPAALLGEGGEAEVYDLGDGRVLKLFKPPDHPDFRGRPEEQAAVGARLEAHQRKLGRLLPGAGLALPPRVVVPALLATDRSGRRVLGYAMRKVAPAEPLACFAEPEHRRRGGSAARTVALLGDLHATLGAVHRAGVVVGDLNDLNVLVDGTGAWLIDADSVQLPGFPCEVYSERFLDPLRVDANAACPARPARPPTEDSDWYAYAVMVMQSLLQVGPWGGVHRPRDPARRVPPSERALRRVSVFDPEVLYPKPALPWRVLSDELLVALHRTFVEDRRGPFPRAPLDGLVWTRCPRCTVEHARGACPLCSPSAGAGAPRTVMVVRGAVTARRVLETEGEIVDAAVDLATGQATGRSTGPATGPATGPEAGVILRWLVAERRGLVREDGRVALAGAPGASPDPSMESRVAGARTLVRRGGELVVLADGRVEERLSVDPGPASFDTGGGHCWRVAGGRLLRDGAATPLGRALGPTWIGDVLAGQTRIRVGPAFGVGLYRAGGLAVLFVFGATRPGLNEVAGVGPLPGRLLAMDAALDERRAWLRLELEQGGRRRERCLVLDARGEIEASLDGASGDEPWLGSLAGGVAAAGFLLVPTDEGVVRVEVDGGRPVVARRFPDTEPFVDARTRLLAGREGLYTVGRRHIDWLRLG